MSAAIRSGIIVLIQNVAKKVAEATYPKVPRPPTSLSYKGQERVNGGDYARPARKHSLRAAPRTTKLVFKAVLAPFMSVCDAVSPSHLLRCNRAAEVRPPDCMPNEMQ